MKGDLGKEKHRSRRGPHKAVGEMSRSHGAREVYMSTVPSLHFILGVMGNPWVGRSRGMPCSKAMFFTGMC